MVKTHSRHCYSSNTFSFDPCHKVIYQKLLYGLFQINPYVDPILSTFLQAHSLPLCFITPSILLLPHLVFLLYAFHESPYFDLAVPSPLGLHEMRNEISYLVPPLSFSLCSLNLILPIPMTYHKPYYSNW